MCSTFSRLGSTAAALAVYVNYISFFDLCNKYFSENACYLKRKSGRATCDSKRTAPVDSFQGSLELINLSEK